MLLVKGDNPLNQMPLCLLTMDLREQCRHRSDAKPWQESNKSLNFLTYTYSSGFAGSPALSFHGSWKHSLLNKVALWISRDNQRNWQQHTQLKSTAGTRMYIPVWEQLAMGQTDSWQVVPRQVFTPYNCLLISVAFVVLCCIGCLWVTGVRLIFKNLSFG